MTQETHPTDETLLDVINANDEVSCHEKIETHISGCADCQSRLLKLANHDWLTDFRDCLSADLLLDTNHSDSTEWQFGGERLTRKLPVAMSDYESGAIRQMLDTILEPPTHPETLGRLGRYEVENVVGVGGMGLVLRGYDRELQRPVAIKMMLPRLANNGTAKQRFIREARAVGAILHPNVVAIHGVEESKGMPWIVMPFVAGPSLRQLVDAKGPLPEREIARIGVQIASGLAAAHGQGLVHRDIKPENVLVDNKINRVVITDFGLARRESDEALTHTGVLAGTLNYMSPEQTRGEDIDGRSDLFSLGALLYYLASGSVPFRSETAAGTMHQVSNVPHADVRSLNPEISKALATTIDKLLAKRPSRRFQSAAELEDYFEKFVSYLNKPTLHRIPRVPNRSVGTRRIALTVLVASLVLAGFWIYNTTFNSAATKEASSPELIWEAIQAEYEIVSPAQFQSEFEELDDDMRRVEIAIAKLDDGKTEDLKRRTLSIGSELNRMDAAVSKMEATGNPE